jgi:DNA-binding NarL/FixJ family response regulator
MESPYLLKAREKEPAAENGPGSEPTPTRADGSRGFTTMSTTIRVVIADDHPLVLSGLDHLLREHPEFTVVDRCSTGAQAIIAVGRHQPDILLLDLQLPDMDGLAVARALQTLQQPPRIVLLTAQLHEDELIEAIRLGIRGVVLKEMAAKLLLECLRRVHGGGQWLEKESASRAMAKLVHREARAREVATLLTPREIDVVRLIAKGLSNKEIAARLGIADGTVKIHLHNIYEKVKINRRAELVGFANEFGLT